jgi:hypothetical protein
MTLYVSSSSPPDIACIVWLLESATITLPTDVVTISLGSNGFYSKVKLLMLKYTL